MPKLMVRIKILGFKVSRPIKGAKFAIKRAKIMLISAVSAFRRAKVIETEPSNNQTPLSFFPALINTALKIEKITKEKTTTESAIETEVGFAKLIFRETKKFTIAANMKIIAVKKALRVCLLIVMSFGDIRFEL